MQPKTAEVLVTAIADATAIAIDNRNKITALEFLLAKTDPTLFEEYTTNLEKCAPTRQHDLLIQLFQICKQSLLGISLVALTGHTSLRYFERVTIPEF